MNRIAEGMDSLIRLVEAGTITDDQAQAATQALFLGEIAGRLAHQMRLVSHVADTEPGIQPYCVCGWIGDAGYAYQDVELSRQYRAHIEGEGS